MRTIWGDVTEVTDLGVVAEQCPHCAQIMPCLLRSVCRCTYVCFLKTTDPTLERSCLCTGCHRAFPGEPWRYAAVVPIQEAKALPPEDLLARTNPGLAECLQLQEQVRALGGDPRFTAAYQQLEGMRPGALRVGLLRQLLEWERLPEERRALLAQHIEAEARAWQFSRQVAPAFPGNTGCLAAAAAALVLVPVFLLVPAARSWLWGGVTVAASLAAAWLVGHVLFTRRVCRWTRKTLVPEAQDANISLACLLDVVDDVPGSRLGLTEDLWPMKDQLETIRGVLVADGLLKPTPPAP
jgi:hypothetical protein